MTATRTSWRRRPPIAAVSLSIEADRRSTLLTFLSFGLRPAIPIAIAYLIKVLIDDSLRGDRHGMVVIAALIATAAAVSMATITYPIELNTRMIEATASLADTRLMTLVARVREIARLEDPDVLDRLEVLRQERVYLSEGGDAFSLLLGAGVRAILTAVVLATVSPLLLVTPVFAVPWLLATNRAQRLRAQAVDGGARAARLRRRLYQIGSSPEAGKEIRLFGLAGALRRRHAESAEAADRPVLEAMTRNLATTSLASLFFAAGYLGSLLFVLSGYGHRTTSLGNVVLTVGLVAQMNLQVSQAVGFVAFFKETVAATRRLLDLEELLRVPEDTAERAVAPARLVHGIILRDVTFQYPGSTATALRNVNAFLPAGSVVALVGRNGSGKSTLVKLLAGLYEPTAGQITVDGVVMKPEFVAGWQSATSASFQDYAKFEMTLRHSIGVGELARLDDETAIMAAVERGAAAEVVAALPGGLNARLGRSFPDGADLSGGQWQRVALARARMRTAPCLLLLDEPTAAIDPIAEQQLLQHYIAGAREAAGWVRGITLFTSHRMSTTRAADLILVIEDGTIVQAGHHDELMARRDGPYSEMYERQAAAYA